LADNDVNIEIRQIKPSDRVTGLSLGNEAFTPLKIFLQNTAQKYESQSLSRTYAAFLSDTGKVVGYITLVCGEVVTENGDEPLIQEEELGYPYKHYPAVKIARLAVDRRVGGIGLGRYLVKLALGQAKNIICPAVGCRFVVVDSKTESVNFYQKCGFTLLDTPANKNRKAPVMWIDLNKVSTTEVLKL
jgi:predicted N-acetyltransferase YhbS